MQRQVTDVYSVDENLTFLNVIVPRNEVDECRLSSTALPDESHGLALWNLHVDVLEHPVRLTILSLAVVIGKGNVAELNLVFEGVDVNRVRLVDDFRLCHEYFVDTLHRRQSLRNVVTCLGEVLQWVDDAVEDDEIIDESRSCDDRIGTQDKRSAEPQDDDNHNCA